MPTTEIRSEAVLTVAAAIPADQPVFMLNLVRYRPQADYGERPDAPPCSGREAYLQRYVPAFNQVAANLGVEGIKPFYFGGVLAGLVAPSGESWDDLAVVEYPNFAAFRRVSESPEYRSVAYPHRRAALADWRLIATQRIAL